MPRLLRGVARTAVVAGTASAVAGRVNRHQQQKWAAQDAPPQEYAPEPQYAQPQYAAPPPEPAPVAPAEDPIELLTKLGELHSKGILTDEEFAIEKAKILR